MRDAGSGEEKPRVGRRRFLRPDEANRLIEAAGRRGRYPFRDKVTGIVDRGCRTCGLCHLI